MHYFGVCDLASTYRHCWQSHMEDLLLLYFYRYFVWQNDKQLLLFFMFTTFPMRLFSLLMITVLPVPAILFALLICPFLGAFFVSNL